MLDQIEIRRTGGAPPIMDRQPIDSHLIRSVGYDLTASVLEIELVDSGRVYRYFDVPYSIVEELMNVESKGAYFNEQVRDMYAYEEDEPA